ncbi:MAG TPA: hemerythrin domain-containing protein [Planctomycetota bacterium]|jgi:hypothetical protein|nr:hemerythrin domain-containing protein [Planctomycetota bacterium]
MPSGFVFPSPSDLLIHDHFHLKDLFADYERLVPREREKKAEMIRRIGQELRGHFRIEERLLYPALLTLKSRAVQELVRTAKSEHGSILKACDELSHLENPEQQERMMRALFKQVVSYADFEEKRLLPWAKTLPGVTLREMSLEIEELKGEGPRPE